MSRLLYQLSYGPIAFFLSFSCPPVKHEQTRRCQWQIVKKYCKAIGGAISLKLHAANHAGGSMSQLKNMYSAMLGEDFPETLTIILGNEKLVYEKRLWEIDGQKKGLRYGENPDQPAALYRLKEGAITIGGISWRTPENAIISKVSEKQMIQAGKHPGKTNLTDVDNGANILQYLTEKPACVILKHNNPCGAAWRSKESGGLTSALSLAYDADRIAAFGGAIVVNAPLSKECAAFISERYFEVVAAPAFEDGTVDLLKKRKNLRILELPGLAELQKMRESVWLDIRSLSDGGLIIQKSFQNRILEDADFLPATAKGPDGLEVAAKFPDRAELADLRFAWAIEAGVSSNSAVFARDGVTTAIGTGEQDRVGCIDLAIHKAYIKYADLLAFNELGKSWYELEQQAENNPEMAKKLDDIRERSREARGGLTGSRMVSDGFFPFRDGVDRAIAQGVSAIAHPGGSIRDFEAIQACNEATPQVAMAFTAQRSFRH